MSEWSGRYEYTETNVKRYVPTSGGVYRLIYKKDNDNYIVFYVGQSQNLERRLLEHLASSEQDSCIKRYLENYTCYFRWIEISSQSDRDEIEQEQISKYKPACND